MAEGRRGKRRGKVSVLAPLGGRVTHCVLSKEKRGEKSFFFSPAGERRADHLGNRNFAYKKRKFGSSSSSSSTADYSAMYRRSEKTGRWDGMVAVRGRREAQGKVFSPSYRSENSPFLRIAKYIDVLDICVCLR